MIITCPAILFWLIILIICSGITEFMWNHGGSDIVYFLSGGVVLGWLIYIIYAIYWLCCHISFHLT